MIRFLANLRLRRKLLIAMAPLVLMVIAARVYSSIQIKAIDTGYSQLIDKDVKALRALTEARALTMRSGLELYQLIAELDPDKMQVIGGELDKTHADYETTIAESLRLIPEHANKIKAAAALYNKAMTDARAARAASLLNNNEKAMNIMRGGVDAEL